MNKLSKEQVQKIVVSILMLVVVLAGFFNLVLAPLKKSIADAEKHVSELETQVTAANEQIMRTQKLEEAAATATNMMDLVSEYMPEGAPVAWFPPKMVEFFDRHGFKNVVTRPTDESNFADPKLAEFMKVDWTIQMPSADFVPLGIAVAALENQEPFLDITRVEIITSADHPQYQRVNMSARTVLKK